MKKIQLYIIFCFAFAILGCQKDSKTHFYSCDDDINNWVIENESEIENMSRTDLLLYNNDYQRPIFRAFTSKQRLSCWKDKLNEVLVLQWDTNERLHIYTLLKNLDINWFVENNYVNGLNPQILRDDFIKNWIEKGINEIGWSKGLVHSMIVCMETNVSDNGYLIESVEKVENSNSLKESGAGTCTCSTASDWCNLGGDALGSCKEHADNCRASTMGCGTLWTFSCNGKCRLGTIYDL